MWCWSVSCRGGSCSDPCISTLNVRMFPLVATPVFFVRSALTWRMSCSVMVPVYCLR